MRAVIVYESMFGSTKKVAEAIAEGLADCAEVSVVPVTSADAHILDGALVPGAVSGPGVREWLASLGRLEVAGAAFDTRLQGLPAFTGRASKSIRRLLAHHGARIAASPESFLVKGLTGALVEGELGRARAWGERLSGVTAAEASSRRRQAS